jgi:hypothetical protein
MNRLTLNFILIVATASTVGCYEPSSRLNAPPQGESPRPSSLQEPYVYMVDNAMLADMALADIHFVPHSAELNSLGARRLDRYAALLELYGGTLHYDAGINDAELVNARIDRMKDFLATTGIPSDRIDVDEGMATGRGLNSIEAIVIRAANIVVPETPASGGTASVSGSSGQ